MILDELVLHDVGLFGGRNVLTLTPPSESRPIVLIGGLNGAGKTTILEAIHLALYGSLAQPSTRRGGSYDTYLRSLIHHRASQSAGASVELAFHAHSEGEVHHYRLIRSWRTTPSGTRDRLQVERDGRLDKALTATWPESVDLFVPRGIAGLFFFDGEQIESLADLDRSREVLNTALAALLGLDLVDRLATDLTAIRRRHRDAQVPPDLRDGVESAKGRATELRQAEERAMTKLAQCREAVERADKELAGISDEWRAAGGELAASRESAVRHLANCQANIKVADESLRDLAAGAAPLLLVADQVSMLADQARVEWISQRNQIVLDVLAARDDALLERITNHGVDDEVLRDISDFMAADYKRRSEATQIPNVTALGDPSGVAEMAATIFPRVRSQLNELLERRQTAQQELEDAERHLAAIPDPESLQGISEERARAETNAARASSAYDHAEEQLQMLRQDRQKADTLLESALAKASEATLAVEDEHRVVEHVGKVLETLSDLRRLTTERHVERIAALVLQALQRLLRKSDLITAIQIDPATQTVELTGSEGLPISANDLSAGERQLLAVALLWGLAQAAGQPLPVVIDTPLGRLDRSHRGHLVERYFPYASHQVLLLSTDTEIDTEAREALKRFIGHTYLLDYESKRGATTIRSGYFWEE